MSIGIPRVVSDVTGVLEKLEMGFIPVPALNPKHPSTSFKVRGKSLRVDLLTPKRSWKKDGPVVISGLKAAAHPVPYLDFLIEETERRAVVNSGGILVNVPSPARFAFHKLIISGAREATFHTKVEKDLLQASQVFSVLVEERAGDVLIAWDEVKRRGKGWVSRVTSGLSLLKASYPEEHKKIVSLLYPHLLTQTLSASGGPHPPTPLRPAQRYGGTRRTQRIFRQD